MRAAEIIENGPYSPTAIKTIGRAFDEAWNSLASQFSEDPMVIEVVRAELAQIVLAQASGDVTAKVRIRDAAIDAMLVKYGLKRTVAVQKA